MVGTEERLASLEARMDRVDDLHDLIAGMSGGIKALQTTLAQQVRELRAEMGRQATELRSEMSHFRTETSQEIAGLRTELTSQITELRSDVNRRFEQVDHRFEGVDRRFLALEVKVDRHFTWLVGIQLTVMLAVITVLFGAYDQ
jgi:hypothetical protein